jgi:pyridoxamine 5'-phosphate oxidase
LEKSGILFSNAWKNSNNPACPVPIIGKIMDRPIHNQTPFGHPEAGTDPFALFADWFAVAMQADPQNAAAVALATASRENRPSLRMVLLKEHSANGFVFYTNCESRKGFELTENPHAALAFWWPAQERPGFAKAAPDRQVRIEGTMEKTSGAQSDAYFASRPRESQLSAWASPQSSVIEHPVSLNELRKLFGTGKIPRPANWGGYRLVPDTFEFWQGRASRLHDRIRFVKTDTGWETARLAP